jgi:hypothetical protein
MNRRTKLAVAAVSALALVSAGTGTALAAGNDSETPITGEAVDLASAAALEHTGGGRVTETEVGDEESYYEVEVTLDDGSQVDVQLDENVNVVGSSADDDRSGGDADE